MLVLAYNILVPVFPFISPLFPYIYQGLIADDPKTTYGISCVIISIGLILPIFDRKSFIQRMKSNKTVSLSMSLLMIIFGIIFLIESSLILAHVIAIERYYATKIPGGYPKTPEESLTGLLFFLWDGLVFITGILWFVYGFAILYYGTFRHSVVS